MSNYPETDKSCSKCNQVKKLSEFSPDKLMRSGRSSICKKCRTDEAKKTYREHRGEACKWYYNHKEKRKEYITQWEKDHPLEAKERLKKYGLKRRNDSKYNLSHSVSSAVYRSLKNGTKAGRRWEDLIGFTVDQLRMHLEKRFKSGMTWENYGMVWEIDHKIPVAAFNFERPDDIDFRLCWSLKNLQPLGVSENRSKHDKVEIPFQPALAM